MKRTLVLLLIAGSFIISSCSKKDPVAENPVQTGVAGNPGLAQERVAAAGSISSSAAKFQFIPVTGKLQNGDYVIRNKHSLRVLDLKDWNMANGALIQQWGFANSKNQVFRVQKRGEGTNIYTLDVPIAGHKLLDVKDHSRANGATIQLWDISGTAPAINQQWLLEEQKSKPGYYTIISLESLKAADIPDNSTANGALLHLWEKGTTVGDNQLFQFSRYVP